jgi:hypothetical protein
MHVRRHFGDALLIGLHHAAMCFRNACVRANVRLGAFDLRAHHEIGSIIPDRNCSDPVPPIWLESQNNRRRTLIHYQRLRANLTPKSPGANLRSLAQDQTISDTVRGDDDQRR